MKKKEIGKNGRKRGEKKEGRNIKRWEEEEEERSLAAMCNFVVGRACVLCHGQPVGEDAEESLVGKGGGGSRKRNEVEEGGEREKKLNPRDFIGALPLPRSVSVELFARGKGGVTVENRDGDCPGKMCFTRERKWWKGPRRIGINDSH